MWWGRSYAAIAPPPVIARLDRLGQHPAVFRSLTGDTSDVFDALLTTLAAADYA